MKDPSQQSQISTPQQNLMREHEGKLKETVDTAQKEALRRFITQIVEQELEDKKIVRQARIINNKNDNLRLNALHRRQQITQNHGMDYQRKLIDRDRITQYDRLQQRLNDHHFGPTVMEQGYPVLK